MREIKFRVWDKKKRIMIKPDYIGINNLGNIFYFSALADNWCTAPNPEDVALLQYTGLKDCNGKEIYEGDIIVVRVLQDGDEYCWDNEKQEPIPQLVKWDEKKCGFDFGHASRICYCPYHFEVIGDVYNNPELLKKGDKLNE